MIRLTLLSTLMVLVVALPVQAESRIGVVDLRKALFSSAEARSFSETLQTEFADEERQVRAVQDEARDIRQRLDQDAAMMNEAERKRLTRQFEEKVQEFNELKQRLDTTVANRKQSFLEEARPEVDRAVKELLEEHELDLILPSEAVVYAKPDLDLTDELLEKLDR